MIKYAVIPTLSVAIILAVNSLTETAYRSLLLITRDVPTGATLSTGGADTVKIALFEVTPFAEAVTVALPCARVEATPLPLSVATAVLLDAHVTDPEILPELPSE